MRVTLRDVKKEKNYNLHGAYIGDAAGRSRLRITAESGQLVMDLVANGPKLELCLPNKDRYLSGTREDLLNAPRCALGPIARCVGARDLFFPLAAPDELKNCDSFRLNGSTFFNAADEGYSPKYTRRATVKTALASVECIEWFLRGGVSAGSINYSDSRPHEGLTAAQKSKTPALSPRKISIRPPGAAFILDLEIEDLTLNTNIAPIKFVLAVPANYKREELAEALKDNVNLWE